MALPLKSARLRMMLWRLLAFSETFALMLAEARLEAALPGSDGDAEAHARLQRILEEEFVFANYLRLRVEAVERKVRQADGC